MDLELKLAWLEHNVDLESRIVHVWGAIGEDLPSHIFDLALTELERLSSEPIIIRINSEGGGVYDTLAMVSRMRQCKCKVITEGYGSIMSAATLLLSAGKHRRISKIAWTMVHEATNYNSAEGKASAIRADLRHLDQIESLWNELMGQFTKKSARWWEKATEKKDLYLTAQECVNLGMADEIF